MTELNLYKTRQLSAVQCVLSAEDIASSRFKIGSRSKIMQVPTCMLRGIRLQQDFPLTEAAANAVEDGVNASKSSSRSLQTFRLRRVLLLGTLRANSFRSNRRTEVAIDASGMGRL